MTDMTGRNRSGARGFSLVELLLAIGILGIGMISIAALFPAGIVQQQRSVDDIMGPIVANNAISVLRGGADPRDFGTFEEWGAFPPRITIEGDWPWLRPSFIFPDADPNVFPSGAIDLFNAGQIIAGYATANEAAGGASPLATGLPMNRTLHPDINDPPLIAFTQTDRYYPMGADFSPDTPDPQYVWDCMFRRFQGRILVAIFVYRISLPGGSSALYTVGRNGDVPPLPVWIDLTSHPKYDPWDTFGFDPGDPLDDAFIADTDPGVDGTYDPSAQDESWQAPRQWILDQNNNVHRVLGGRRTAADGPVELVRPPTAMPALPIYLLDFGAASPSTDNVVSDIFYLPTQDTNGVLLTPVYVTVMEL